MAQRLWQLGFVVILMTCMLIVAYTQQGGSGEILFPATAGDSVYIRSATGTRILIDTGNDAPALLALLAHYQPPFAPGIADYLILTQPGAAWQGGRTAVLQHGVREVWFLPAMAAELAPTCRDSAFRCRMIARGTTFSQDGLSIRVISDESLRVDWAGGALLIAHGAASLADAENWPQTGIRVVEMPWSMPPPRALLVAIAPTHIIYQSGQKRNHPARLSYAERRVGAAHLLHRDIDGTIRIRLDGLGQVWRDAQE
ncbi:MAG: hypothetical protein RLY87_249 [Chloroflexota bacterium]|jgi:hypothetical protein